MFIAAFGDVHGNLPALGAVLTAIDDAGIQTILNTGDCVGGYPWPNEVIDLLRTRRIPTVQGEMDRRTVHFLRKRETLRRKWSQAEFEAMRETYEALRADNLEFLRELPHQRTFILEGLHLLLCHGMPNSPSGALSEDDSEDRFRRLREAANADIIVCGRTHIPFARMVDATLFVNPGAVGVPTDDARLAHYAIIDTETDPWAAHFHDVPW